MCRRPTHVLTVLLLGLVAFGFAAVGAAQTAEECRQPITLGRGPVGFVVPSTYNPQKPTPLIVLLHPFASAGSLHSSYMQLGEQAEAKKFIYAYPDGTTNPAGKGFWNATDACCDIFGSGVDDTAYLLSLVEALEAQCNIDPRRIYFGGLSNGGFMSHRMACEHADKVAAIASLAGTTFDRQRDCRPSEPVHVLQIHGTADQTISYGGGRIFGLPRYPGAKRTVRHWARRNGCSRQPEVDPLLLDFDTEVPEAESTVERYERACEPGGSVELWSLEGSGHVPAINNRFRKDWVDYLLEHRKPAACVTREAIGAAFCRDDGAGIVRLKGGEGRARYTVELDTGRTVSGLLKPNGRARVVLRDLEAGPHEVTVRWDCGAESTRTVVCPSGQ